MPAYQTKLKVGRKLEGVDTATASDNQISALFRYDDEGNERHVSLSIESDSLSPDDVFAIFQLLHDRGVLVASQSKTWLNQPSASREEFGETTEWQDQDLSTKVDMLKRGLKVRGGGAPGQGPGAEATLKTGLVKVAEVERKLAELKDTLKGSGETVETSP